MTQYSAQQLATISKLVDDIGMKKAELAGPLTELGELEARLKQYGKGEYSGEFYDATVSVFPRLSLIKDKVLAKLKRLGVEDPDKWCRQNSKSSIVTKLTCTAKQKARAERSAELTSLAA